ncbi:flagellar hook-length control protein FliK [Rhizobium sp. P32RR-XVIII]|uniref:flagellar hook-length control protein FliK n=1 Tax=Rhizobium sp. P32RR-XVIII TaxID=2726738 RepID=UPI0014566BFC|nr:flagellar hook-length control protein FliK [Rhizobium sp. P32RR-XVIII]NLS02400.1 flagellar hook-length control protein FliK [Rhizobium sp. P32RR-XVIII]
MDMSVPGGGVAAEAAQATRGNGAAAKRDDQDKGGFSDLVSKAGSSSQNNDSVNQAGTDRGDAPGSEDAHAADGVRQGARMKPMIALRDASLKQHVLTPPEAAITIGKSGKDQIEDGGDTAAETLDVKNGISRDDKAEAHPVKGTKPAKTSGTRGDRNADPSSLSGADSASDVLGLLNSDSPDARFATAIPLVHMNAKNDTAGEKASGGKGAVSTARLRGVETPEPGAAQTALAAIGANTSDAQLPATDGAADADGKTKFRLSRADGRGQSMDMRIAVDQDSSASGKVKGDGETVTVLDSRRFIGLAQNSASVTAAISGDSEWARAMQPGSALSNAAEWTSTGKVVNTLKIQMAPVDLGVVTATMRLSGDALNVDLKVATGAAYRQLKEDQDHIIEALRSQGYAVDKVTISMAPAAQPDAGNQPNAQGQFPQHQQSLQQGQGGEARERHSQPQGGNGGFNGGGETDAETASGTSGSGAPGSVYL